MTAEILCILKDTRSVLYFSPSVLSIFTSKSAGIKSFCALFLFLLAPADVNQIYCPPVTFRFRKPIFNQFIQVSNLNQPGKLQDSCAFLIGIFLIMFEQSCRDAAGHH